MATILSFLSGRQITDDDGEPVSGALLYHYQAGTTNNLTVYSNQAGSIAHAQPVVCDAGGFVPLIYVGETSDWKVVIQTPAAVTLHTYDNLPAAVASVSADDFAPPLFEWTQVTSASSPVALTAADAGKAYEANTTSGNIEFDLPSAASVGNGKGFVFKKTGAANSLIIDPNASETIDDVSTSLTVTASNAAFGIYSNGAEWYKTFEIAEPIDLPTVQRFTSGSGTYTPAAGLRYIRGRILGPGGGGGAQATNAGSNGSAATSLGTWAAAAGSGGPVGSGNTVGGAGGTGGTDGTGTLIRRIAGGRGGPSQAGAVANQLGTGGGNAVSPSTPTAQHAAAGLTAAANSGAGGSGGGSAASAAGGGGGGGEHVEFWMTAAQIGASLSYAVGAGGAGGAAGTFAGGDGAAGLIIVEEYY